MSVSYDVFTGAFLRKIEDLRLPFAEDRDDIVAGYMRAAVSQFKKICDYDLVGTMDDELRLFNVDVDEADIDEIVDIVSEGMVAQWLKPFVYRQENLENILNTKDFTTYSPANLLSQVGSRYDKARADFTNMMREYSYNHGDLTDLHL